jgi:predicted Zn-dependent protease
MSKSTEKLEQHFYQTGRTYIESLSKEENLTLSLNAEKTFFTRFNGSKVRQMTDVVQGVLTLKFQKDSRTITHSISFLGNSTDEERVEATLGNLRSEATQLPKDPHYVEIKNNGNSSQIHAGQLLEEGEENPTILKPIADKDFCGIYTSGIIYNGNMNSKGQQHWFSTESYYIDYSLYSPNQKAVKGCFAGTNWSDEEYSTNINKSKKLLEIMEREPKHVKKGSYRTYLASAAVNDMLDLMCWNGFSRSSMEKNGGPLKGLFDKSATLSSEFNLNEDFSLGLVPLFNNDGEVSSEKIEIVKNGKLENLLISSRTAKEYSIPGNGASTSESPRSLVLAAGTLKEEDILKELGTGLYLSNLWYLNWSDMQKGRITGMTRYACFWVENGEIICPIKDLRFDESLYNFFGGKLIAMTEHREIIPNTSTYFSRGIGGTQVPGILVDDFTFTL